MNRRLRIGFISDKDPSDRGPWSGTKNRLYEQVKECASEVVWIKVRYDWTTYIFRVILLLMAKLMGRKYSSIHTTFIARRLSSSISKEDIDKVDVLFVPSGAQYLYKLDVDKPIVYLADATFRSIYDYYSDFSNFFSFNRKQGEQIDQNALNNSTHIIVSSDWCKESVVNDYGIPKSKISVIEFGANIDSNDVPTEIKTTVTSPLQLVFIGVEWERKGGDIAVDCVQKLNEMGITAELNIIGVTLPERYREIPFITEIGRLNKNISEQYEQFTSIVGNCDLLLLPTQAECAGVAFCEASAYGLPTLTYDTGGTPNYVKNGINGYRLPLSANGLDFALRIKVILENDEFPTLRKGCKTYYNSHLNWQVWRKNFSNVLANNIRKPE